MTADTITAIKKALEGVTPGPWGCVPSNENHGPYVCNDWGAGDICDGYVMSKPDSLSIRNGGDSRPINHQHDEADANMCYIAAINPEAITKLLSTIEEMRASLEWYGEQARLARLIHSEGDKGRHALADDGGKRARAALSSTGDTHGN